MTKDLAKTLTIALVSYLDENRPEGTMDCSSGECVSLENAFVKENFDSVETLINKKLSRLTEFELRLLDWLSSDTSGEIPMERMKEVVKNRAAELLAIAKKELLSYADESNPAIEAMADLERAVTCGNINNIPKWLAEELNKAFKKGQESSHEDYIRGYTNGYKDAEKKYNESVAYHYPEPVPPGVAYKSPQCYTDVMITPNTNSGTSTLKAEG